MILGQKLGLGLETASLEDGAGLPGVCFELPGSLELMAAVFRYSFAFPEAGNELNEEQPLA